MEIKYGPPSEQFIKKHGNFNCACCREEGNRVRATQIPLGWPKSIIFKRDFASCDMHLEVSRNRALDRIRFERSEYNSEADCQLAQNFGI